MNHIEEFVDQRHKGWCVHCAKWIDDAERNRDHVPSRSLVRKPYPPNLPTVSVCKSCNEGFSSDEEYLAAFLGCVLTGSTDPDRQDNPTVERILKRSPSLRSRIEGARREARTHVDAIRRGSSGRGVVKINFLRPAVGRLLVAEATVLRLGRALVVSQATVRAADGDNWKAVAVMLQTNARVAANR